MDAIASAFRLRQPHEEYHKNARKMANDFLYGFICKAHEYTNDLLVIRTAPTIDELEFIYPTKFVWCTNRYIFREMDDEERALDRIVDAVEWCRLSNIPVIKQTKDTTTE